MVKAGDDIDREAAPPAENAPRTLFPAPLAHRAGLDQRERRCSRIGEEPMSATMDRAEAFCARFGLGVPILLAPMAGASAPSLSIAVANAGGLGSCGVLLMQPDEIMAWAAEVRANSNGAFQLNIWIPDPAPQRDPAQEARVREFLPGWGPPVPPE